MTTEDLATDATNAIRRLSETATEHTKATNHWRRADTWVSRSAASEREAMRDVFKLITGRRPTKAEVSQMFSW